MSKRAVSEFFDSYAHNFDAIYGNENNLWNSVINRLLRKSMRSRYFKSLEGCDPIEGRSVLDVGCGPGHFSIALASRGAAHVLGVDFAPGMIEIAKKRAAQAGVGDRCQFVTADFLAKPPQERFDYTIVAGFMDYAAEPQKVVDLVLSLTKSKAFFSFPVKGGLLGWQRQLRYRNRCDLYLYGKRDIENLFTGSHCKDFQVERISRDFFVTATPS